MSVDRYGVTHQHEWGLLILVASIGIMVGAIGSYLALAKSRETMAAGWRSCEERLDAGRDR